MAKVKFKVTRVYEVDVGDVLYAEIALKAHLKANVPEKSDRDDSILGKVGIYPAATFTHHKVRSAKA